MKKLLLGAAIALSLIGNAAAQDRNYQHRRMFVVKRDRMGDFEAAIKDLHAIYKKAGVVAPTLVVQSLTGEDNFLTIRYYSKLSEAMADRRAPFKNNHEGEYIAANIRLASTLAERQTVVSMREADLSVTGATEVPAYFRVVRTVVKPDKVDAYKALLKEYVDAGVKPGGVKSYTVLRTLMGREATEIATGMGVAEAPRRAGGIDHGGPLPLPGRPEHMGDAEVGRRKYPVADAPVPEAVTRWPLPSIHSSAYN